VATTPGAEKPYRQILAEMRPNNLYTLSNLGVVFSAARQLRRPKIIPEGHRRGTGDGFSHARWAIIYYSRGKYDEAVNELNQGPGNRPQGPIPHTYLGIGCEPERLEGKGREEFEAAPPVEPGYHKVVPAVGDFLTPLEWSEGEFPRWPNSGKPAWAVKRLPSPAIGLTSAGR